MVIGQGTLFGHSSLQKYEHQLMSQSHRFVNSRCINRNVVTVRKMVRLSNTEEIRYHSQVGASEVDL